MSAIEIAAHLKEYGYTISNDEVEAAIQQAREDEFEGSGYGLHSHIVHNHLFAFFERYLKGKVVKVDAYEEKSDGASTTAAGPSASGAASSPLFLTSENASFS